jgi:hypothetical protein
MYVPSLQLRKRAPSSVSAADVTVNLMTEHVTWMAPFRMMGWVGRETDRGSRIPLLCCVRWVR